MQKPQCGRYENIEVKATRLFWTISFSCCFIVIYKIYGQYLCVWFIDFIIYCSTVLIFLDVDCGVYINLYR